jgi:type I restriction enzyme S subunit
VETEGGARVVASAKRRAKPERPSVAAGAAKISTTVRVSELFSVELRLDASSHSIQRRRAVDELRSGRFKVQPLFGPDGLCAESHNAFRFRRVYVSPERGVPFLSSSEIIRLDEATGYYVSRSETKGLEKLLIKPWDVLISCSGTIGNISLAGESLAGKALSQDAIRLRHPDVDIAGYIAAFLRSSFGRAQLVGVSYGSVIPHIEPHHLGSILIPEPSALLVSQIGRPMVVAVKCRDEANRLIRDAKRLLIERFNLPPFDNLKRDHRNMLVSVVRASSLGGRLDAGYHSGLTLATEGMVAGLKGGVAKLGDPEITKEIRAITTFRTRVYVERGGIPFVGSRQLFQFDPIDVKRLSTAAHAKHLPSIALKAGMLVLNRSGRVSIGHVQIVPRYMEGWAASEHATRVIAADEMNPGYLFAWLASEYGQQLVRRHDYGSVVPTIDKGMLASVPVPLATKSDRDEIGDLVLKANELRDQAWRLERDAIGKLEHLITDRPQPIAVVQEVGLGGRAIPFEPAGAAVDLEQRFNELTTRWREDTKFMSSVSDITGHPAYRAIIDMGPAALPYIFRELASRPAHWYNALKTIAGESPVQPNERSNPKRVREAWLQWGRAKKLIP